MCSNSKKLYNFCLSVCAFDSNALFVKSFSFNYYFSFSSWARRMHGRMMPCGGRGSGTWEAAGDGGALRRVAGKKLNPKKEIAIFTPIYLIKFRLLNPHQLINAQKVKKRPNNSLTNKCHKIRKNYNTNFRVCLYFKIKPAVNTIN